MNCGGVQLCSGYRVAVRWMSFRLEPYDKMRQYTVIVHAFKYSFGVESVAENLCHTRQ